MIYYKSDGQLPTTLTELYEKFILQTVRRHVKIKSTHNIEPRLLYSLHHLPSLLGASFQEICHFAYLSLKDNRMTFSLFQLQSLPQSVKEDYLGLMTTFSMRDEDSYQFLHLSIQEFLAAWWIAKYEKTEEVFAEHFDNDHFRMCLMFVAGLTHLEHESYQQYFNKELDLQCKMRPLFGFEKCYYSHNLEYIRPHCYHIFSDQLDMFLLHLLYESQNKSLCQKLSHSIKNHSLCLQGNTKLFSLFDVLCLSYFLNNSNTTWNYLDLGQLSEQAIQVLTNTLTNNILCIKLEVILQGYGQMDTPSLMKLFQSSLCHNLQESYITLNLNFIESSHCLNDATFMLLQFIKLNHLKILHFTINLKSDDSIPIDEVTLHELEISLHNSTLKVLAVEFVEEQGTFFFIDISVASIVNSVIKGVTRNKSIQTFLLTWNDLSGEIMLVNDGIIEDLLEDNHIIQNLELNIPDDFIPSLDIVAVNTPLTALEIEGSDKLATVPFQHIKGLQCLDIQYMLYPPDLPLLFQCHPNLQQLELTLPLADSVIELFTILQTNTILKALKVEIVEKNIFDVIGPTLQNMLSQNQAIEYLEINILSRRYTIYGTYLSFLTTGLSHNTSLQELSVSISLSDTNYEQITTFFNVISHKNNLTELKLDFLLDQSCVSDNCSRDEIAQIITPLFYESIITHISNLLKSHTTMRLLYIQCKFLDNVLSHPNWKEVIQQFWQTIFLHPSLQYIGIEIDSIGFSPVLMKEIAISEEEVLFEKYNQQQQLIKHLPIIEWKLKRESSKSMQVQPVLDHNKTLHFTMTLISTDKCICICADVNTFTLGVVCYNNECIRHIISRNCM